jgi:uncharacterized secreted repeat protein (TIGR03808 family)
MSEPIDLTRRLALPMAAFAIVTLPAAQATAKSPAAKSVETAPATAFGLDPTSLADQSARLQTAIDQATARGLALTLPAGKFVIGNVKLRPGSHLIGAAGQGSVLSLFGNGTLLSGRDAHGATLEHLTLDGAMLPLDAARGDGLLVIETARDIRLTGLTVRNSARNGIVLKSVSGSVQTCLVMAAKAAAIFSLDAAGLEISHNTILDCADNGILVWRSQHGEDGTLVSHNRITRISNVSGGTGQYGNGVGIYRAARVVASNNIVSDCTYTAIRANEGSNVQMIANNVSRIGEVALYAEAADERAGAAGFEGAVINSNLIDTAATGIVVTNFNNGGRLAVVQGNLVRNLQRREHEKVDKRGEGIAIEADAVVANNVIENAPTSGIMIGWGRHMRDVIVTGNLIRRARIGIAVTSDGGAGQCLLSHNMISDAKEGAIRAMNHAQPIGADMVAGKGPRHVTLVGNIAV